MMTGNGLIQVPSRHSLNETMDRLQNAFAEKGLRVLCCDRSQRRGRKIGLSMQPTKLLIFGNPKGGTPPMLASPSLAIDLPLKALVAEDTAGRVSVTFNSPEYLQARHGVSPELIRNLVGAGAVIAKAVE